MLTGVLNSQKSTAHNIVAGACLSKLLFYQRICTVSVCAVFSFQFVNTNAYCVNPHICEREIYTGTATVTCHIPGLMVNNRLIHGIGGL